MKYAKIVALLIFMLVPTGACDASMDAGDGESETRSSEIVFNVLNVEQIREESW